MRKLLVEILLVCVFSLLSCLMAPNISAIDYQYGFSLDPPFSHFVVKPDFKHIETEFTVSNSKDPIYLQLSYENQKDFSISIYDIDTDVELPVDTKHKAFLMLPDSHKSFRVEIANRTMRLDPRDYIIDVSAVFKLIQTPNNVQKPLVLEPKIHKSIVLGVTEDGNMSIDPKIALFQNINGHFSALNTPQTLILTVQNRGNYLFDIYGTVTLKGPDDLEEKYIVPATYILANSQKNLSIEGLVDNAFIPVTNASLRSGQYNASVELFISGTNTPTLYAHTTFWLVSTIYVIASVIFCLIMIMVIFFVGLRHT